MSPSGDTAAGIAPAIGDDDIGGQGVGLGPESVGKPTANGWESVDREPAVRKKERGSVQVGGALHGAKDGELVGNFGEMGEQGGNPETALAVLGKFPVALAEHSDPMEVLLGFGGRGLAVEGCELWLVVEGVDLAEATNEADVDSALSDGADRLVVGFRV